MADNYKDDLIERIKRNISKGYKAESLKWALINQGYSRSSVERALKQAIKELSQKDKNKEQKNEKPKITYQLYDENNKLIKLKKQSFWKKLFRK